jgi:beta-galactosidase
MTRRVTTWLCAVILLACSSPLLAADDARQTLSFNQGWRFFRPPEVDPVEAAALKYSPPETALLKQGSFPHSNAPQNVALGSHRSRYVALQSLSAQDGKQFASVAEFYLLDAAGKELPRDGWKVAYVDSEEAGTNDLAINALDGDPDTMWHSQWQSKKPDHPHCIVFDLRQPTDFSGFRILPRKDGNTSGMIKDWKFYAFDQAPPGIATAETVTDVSALKDSAWEIVSLPHTVRLEPLNAAGGRNYQGVCWYRRHFSMPDGWKNKKLLLRFDGAMQVADVWLNGQKLTTHYCGYLPFTVDISAAQPGVDNVLTVRLDNSDNPNVPPGKPQNALDFVYFGGLCHPVHLDVLNPVHISDTVLANKVAGGGIFVTYPAVAKDAATVQIQTDVINESPAAHACKVTQDLHDPSGEVVATGTADLQLAAGASNTVTQQLKVTQPKLWHPNHPFLYTLKTIIASDGVTSDDLTTRIGIRSLRFDTKQGMFINGERFFSLGANRHQDHPYVGYAISPSNNWRDVKKLRDIGFTSIRSHYPQDPSFVEACDELGMLLIVSNPGWQFGGGALFDQRVYQDCREMIRRDRNHPCVILWEAPLNETPGHNKHLFPMLEKIVHEEFPFDPCYAAGDSVANTADEPDWDMVYGGDKKVRPNWWREWGDHVDNWGDQQSPVRIMRGWGETPQLIQAWSHIEALNGVIGSYEGVKGDWSTLRLCGADLWAGVDAYRGYHHQPFLGGVLDLFRLPKFDAYFMASQRPADVHVAGLDDGPMVFIASYATFYSPTTITVFSNCDQVRLSQNGKVIATEKPLPGYTMPHPPFSFKVNQFSSEQSTLFMTGVGKPGTQIGELKAEGLIDGKVVATHIIKPPGVQKKIALEADLAGHDMYADGADWLRIYARICDDRGTSHPYADDPVTFTLEGPATIIDDARIHANPARPEAGIATILIRATNKPGAIKVHAEAFGLTPAEVTIETKPVSIPEAPGRDTAP